MNWLASDAGPDTAGAWREERQRAQRAGLDPADLWALAEQLPYHIELSWARHNAEGAFDALLVRRDQERSARVRWPEAPAGRAAMANDPLRAAYHRHVVPQLRDLLKEHLPEYMRPSAISVLSALPLTPDGHLDRRSLPAPEPEHRDVEQSRVMPRTPLEDVLAGIWASVLGVDQVSVEDNFFELGGHSLLVVQVMARIREAFQVDLPFRSLFETPTVAGLALAMLGQSGQIERRAELLVALARLSDQEVEAMLALDSAALVSAP
jgi:acyl carrier protein